MKKDLLSQKGSTLTSILLEFIQSIVLALSVFVLLYLFIAQPNEVKGSSMWPNFEDGEFLLTDKLSYQFKEPTRGDVVVFRAPPSEPCAEDQCEYIKRVIAVHGDRVMLKNNVISVNNQKVKQGYLSSDIVTQEGEYLKEGVEKVIPEGYFLVMGDNRPHSRDSREFGPIKKDSIVGKAFFKYWPPQSIGLVPKIESNQD